MISTQIKVLTPMECFAIFGRIVSVENSCPEEREIFHVS